MVPEIISKSLLQDLKDFNTKLEDFDQRYLMYLLSKTSSRVLCLSSSLSFAEIFIFLNLLDGFYLNTIANGD
jgi:hypothetical protein